MAQALMAGCRTIDEDDGARVVHSLHGYFLRPGDPKVPAVIKVERLRDGLVETDEPNENIRAAITTTPFTAEG